MNVALKKINRPPRFKRPKRPANPYLLFLRENKDIIKKEQPGSHIKEIVKEIANRWKNLPFKEKKDYFDRYRPEREKYHTEVKELKAKHQLMMKETNQGLKTEGEGGEVKRKRGRPKKGTEKKIINGVDSNNTLNVNINLDNEPLLLEQLLNGNKGKKICVKGTVTLDLELYL